ncbi:hypothetical protein MXF20_11005 [Pantoea dispersa]|uniref:hypothetical protein n=1 Tax=Pantoea dispersa TaxID=59814 RepID=UPI002DBD0750|nr:hypothetical protein [Pantoea dispersa]MEB5972614.1 hypothetical protein [Pantoea dispersa]
MSLKIKTVDVWDTLLRRKCHPDVVKMASARYLYLKYYDLHKQSDLNQLFLKRVEIERQIGKDNVEKGFDDEYLFEDVVFQWCNSLLVDCSSQKISAIRDELCEYEFNLELALTEPDSDIASLLENNPSDKTLFLSDFYMSNDRLKELIKKNGLSNSVSDGYSSADIKLNKRSGHLFDYIKKKYQLNGDDWLHIGDNEWSDKDQPEKRGIKTIHFMPAKAHQIRLNHELQFHDRNALYERTLLNIEMELNKLQKDNSDDVFKLGIKCSPFIVGYVLFVLEKAIENKCDKVFFFTREGEFFIKAFKIIIAKLQSDLPDIRFPEYELLEVSRLATFSASVKDVNINEMMRVWNLYSSQSMDALFKTLDIETDLLKDILVKHSITPEEIIRYPWQDDRVQGLFKNNDFVKILSNHCLNKRNQLISYLSSKGLNNEKQNVCVVDVGWRGTIQDNIALILPQVNLHGIYLGLAKFLNEQPINSKKYSYGPDLNVSNELPHFLDSVAPIEMITNSPSGSVIGYKEINGSTEAIRKIDHDENRAWEDFTEGFQRGILSALDFWKEEVAMHVITSKELRPLAMKIWGDLITGTSDKLNDTFSNLTHNETFGLGGYVNKKHAPSLYDIARAFFNWNKRRELIDFIVANQWSDGVRKRKDLSFLNRTALALIIDLAMIYKRHFMRR